MRVALYCRCSTSEQSVDLQLDGLREYAAVRRFTIVEEYLDEGVSGARPQRPALDRLLKDAERRTRGGRRGGCFCVEAHCMQCIGADSSR